MSESFRYVELVLTLGRQGGPHRLPKGVRLSSEIHRYVFYFALQNGDELPLRMRS